LLAELRRLRDIQLEQRDALVDGDLERLSALGRDRVEIQSTLSPLDRAGLDPADLAEARAIVDVMTIEQEALIGAAAEVCEALGAEIAGLSRGRSVAGYRPTPASRAMHFDKAG
jgi:hypothetical protein